MKPFFTRLFYRKPEKLFSFVAERQNQPWWQALAAVLILLPISVYFYLIQGYCVNVPFNDDFAFLDFLIQNQQAGSFSEKLDLVLQQHNEHRIAIPRLIFLIFLNLNSQVDFKTVALLGNASLLVLLLVFFKLLPADQRKLLILVPPAFLLFQMQHWENAAWAIGATSNFIGFLFSGLAIYFLNRLDRGGFGFSILFSILAVLTSGGGLILFAAIAIYLLIAGKYRRALIWVGVFTAVLFFYFHGYVRPQHHPAVMEAFLHPGILFTYLISFLGSAMSVDNFYFVAFAPVAGLMGLAYFVYLTRRKYYLKNPAVYCFMMFIILVGCAAALTRSGFGLHQAFSSRYKIFSAGFIILAYLSLIELMAAREEKVKAAFLCYLTLFAVAFNILSFPRNSQHLNIHTQKTSYNMKHWVMNQEGANMSGIHIPDEIMTQALKRGIYRFSCDDVPLRRQDREKWCPLKTSPSSP